MLSPKIFEFLEATGAGAGGEIQLTDAIAELLKKEQVDAFRFQGRRFDCGAHIGLIEATVHFALEHEKHGGPAKEILRNALAQADARG